MASANKWQQPTVKSVTCFAQNPAKQAPILPAAVPGVRHRRRIHLIWIALIIFIGAIGWSYADPDWEPFLFLISSLGVLLSQESHFKNTLESLLPKKNKRTILIKEDGSISYCKSSCIEIITPMILGEIINLSVISKEAESLRTYAQKEEDPNKKFHLKNRANILDKSMNLIKDGIFKIAELHKNGFIICRLQDLPIIVESFISLILESNLVSANCSIFDIYTRTKDGDEIWFTVKFNKEETDSILKKFKASSSQDLAIPYNFMVSDIQSEILDNKVIPKQVLMSLTNHKEHATDSQYWLIFNWYIGPH